MVLNWFHRLGSPKTFFQMSGSWLPWLLGLSVLLLLAGMTWALLFVPPDYQQGNSVRIMYIHVPAAILAQSGYVMMAGAAAVFLIWRIKLADMAVEALAPLGASITFLALVTGAIWGKPTWGTWWVWDARLTSVLILLFLYLGYMALWQAIEDSQKAAKAAAVLALVGAVNVPIIKFSVDWWNTLHQPASVLRMDGPAIHPSMLWPLLIMALAFKAYFVTLLLARMRMELNLRRIRALRLAERSS